MKFSLSPATISFFTAGMNRTKNVQGACAKCGGEFEFAAEQIGLMAPCPICGKETELQLAMPKIESAIPKRLVLWTVIALVILVAGLGICVMLLKRAERLAHHNRPLQAPAAENSTTVTRLPGYTVSPIRAERGADGTIYAVGEVVHTGTKALENFELRLQIADAAGKPIGVASLRRTRFAPGEQWAFRERIPNPRAASFQVLPTKGTNSASPR
jgi:hypothetical protein